MAPRFDRLPSFEAAQIIYVHEDAVCDLELPASPMWVDLRGLCHTSLFDAAEDTAEKAQPSAEQTTKAEREALLHHLGGQRMGGEFERKPKASREQPLRCNMMPRRVHHNLQQPRAVY
ncbi:hypothetical protein KFL_002540210 [Klebsormidium nitens]|uniref:Uncharacterized protein n=1 Tax=Klebsormidium nitens TaxID=105231 RepID=A0A1Y1IAP9_KLENI|nr:hypothetical protein KFL_002540210 [Klebsormidium nitens]|eukprot:GAQ85787.1 hypothetical protein KFL_002540210 [Klebsormidium nitens]